MDEPAVIEKQVDVVVPDSLKGTFREAHMSIAILIDERGRITLNDLPWFDPKLLPATIVGLTAATLPEWRCKPAIKLGTPRRVWTSANLTFMP